MSESLDILLADGVIDAVLGAVPANSVIYQGYDGLNAVYPGITVTSGGATYAELNGTSMSSPHAAGVAALVVQEHPGWSPKAVQAAVERTATPMTCPPGTPAPASAME